MTITIDADKAISLLREVVAEAGPDYNYLQEHESCRYVAEDGSPLCIVGRALAKAGIPLDTYREDCWKNESIFDPDSQLPADYVFTNDAHMIFRAAQEVQDGNFNLDTTWGAALTAAEAEFESRRAVLVR